MSRKNTARVIGGLEAFPVGKCDHIGCGQPPILHVELTSPRSEYAAEVDLCARHLGAVSGQARAFLVGVGVLAPSTELERNIRTATEEHGV